MNFTDTAVTNVTKIKTCKHLQSTNNQMIISSNKEWIHQPMKVHIGKALLEMKHYDSCHKMHKNMFQWFKKWLIHMIVISHFLYTDQNKSAIYCDMKMYTAVQTHCPLPWECLGRNWQPGVEHFKGVRGQWRVRVAAGPRAKIEKLLSPSWLRIWGHLFLSFV